MIGVFDSGLGGLTVLRSLLKELPEHDYCYLGDTARVPYGAKSPETVYRYTCEALDFLFAQGANLVILACNTASALALRKIQQEYLPAKYPDRKVLGVVRPLAEAAAQLNLKRVGIIGTKATVNSNVYQTEIHKLAPEKLVWQQAAPLLVPLIEEGWLKKPETRMVLKEYLRPLKKNKIETLILGCTHYPFLFKEIRRLMGRKCLVFDPGTVIALSLKDYLARHEELDLPKKKENQQFFYTTDNPAQFVSLAEFFLGKPLGHLKQAKLD